MYSKSRAQQLAVLFATQCAQLGVPINKAYLFGSHALNKATQLSEVDVALVSDSFGENFILNSKKTSRALINFPDIEVHHFNTEYFEKGDPFIDEIKRTGIELDV